MPKRLKELERLKELAGSATESHLAKTINESGNEIWLAGLGALSNAQHEGGKAFETLVAEGEKVQERMKGAGDEWVTELSDKATGVWDEFQEVFQDRVARVLGSLNVPSRHDIDTLSKRVHVITRKLSEVEAARGRAHRAREVAN
jgi:poly(hydroxyalkanoate) granule-associated protein